MEEYYCHKCSVDYGHLNNESSEYINFTGSAYLLEKFIKHTLPPAQSGLISIFSDPTYDTYKSYIVNTLASGSTMFDEFHRKNIIWYANQNNGLTFLNGIAQDVTDVVKVVLSHDDSKIHCFPVKSTDLITRYCKLCGINVLTGNTTSNI